MPNLTDFQVTITRECDAHLIIQELPNLLNLNNQEVERDISSNSHLNEEVS
jgi:hypothetical protein